ncbi:MAG TPA: phospho-N-acetylmuramoyl-pentapeptide-transferase [Candidatus Dormibacteraeota bacterium]|nr:phospho-N-acetylmuramoyl-pentapeptide-transferase [Candidatus Dormibacteraeota bacterium]
MSGYILDAITLVVATVIGLVAFRPFIALLRGRRAGQVIQAELPEEHQAKAGTPTGGGILFVALAILGGVLATLAGHPGAWPVLAGLALGGVVGLADDLQKLRVGSPGIPARLKFPLQLLLAVPVAALAYQPHQWGIPFSLGWLYWPLAVVAIAGCANGVNLSDGIDGLAGGLTLIALLAAGLLLPGAPAGEKATALVAAGGVLAFLWYNRHPARVFMGDAGSLGLGYALAAMTIQQGFVLLLPLLGLVFVIETLSVMMQVAYFKATGGRRVFKMTPIHFTFQLEGWSEGRIDAVFWTVGALAALASAAVARL